MKSTGIVRKVDDLGRVVIPKETRRTLGIAEGDPLEIYTNGNQVILQKYQPETEKEDVIASLKRWLPVLKIQMCSRQSIVQLN